MPCSFREKREKEASEKVESSSKEKSTTPRKENYRQP